MYEHVLEDLAIGIVACDSLRCPIAVSPVALRLFDRFFGYADELPPVLNDALREWNDGGGLDRSYLIASRGSECLVARFTESTRPPVRFAIQLTLARAPDDAMRAAMRRMHGATHRELQLVSLVKRGYSNHQISAELGLTYGTVKSYLHRLYERFEVRSRTELIAYVDRLTAAR